MAMYEINTAELTAENFLAGDFPIATDFGKVKTKAAIRKHAPLVQGEDGIEEATSETLDKLIGIAADEPSGEEVIFYLTGEFFAEGLTLPDGVTVENLKPAFRKLGIFIKEIKNYG